jgi:hypothetical protein
VYINTLGGRKQEASRFEINAKKNRMRAGAKNSLESATKYGKVDAGRAAPSQLSLVHFCLTFVRSWMPEFSRARCIAQW